LTFDSRQSLNSIVIKGQEISKANDDVFDSSKKRTKLTQDTPGLHNLLSGFTDV